jgi:transcriptional regulator with PAS, ATPase and Fis domain
MNKVIGLKLTDKDKKLIKQIEDSGLSNSELIRKALDQYFKLVNSVNPPVNHEYQEKNNQKVNLVNHTVNQKLQEKKEKTVNRKIQISENYELMEYLKRDNEWLKDRIEHFEHTQDHILAKVEKLDAKAKKETAISLYRM